MRLLSWNIQFFTINRILNTDGNSPQERLKNLSISTYNYNHITGTVLEGDVDVFIVIEPRSQQGVLGSIATGGGPDGLYYIYEGLNIGTGATNWSLVPPLKTVNRDALGNSYTEAVGIFYRSDRLEFLGPWGWPAAVQNNPSNGPSIPPGNNVPTGPYPGRWNGTMPARNDGITYAAQFQFFNANGQEIWFPAQQDRRPILTKFRERGVQNPRTFKIFSCHTPPNTNALQAVMELADLPEAIPGNDEVAVLAGDLNCDYLSTNSMQTAAYQYIRTYMGYTQCFGMTGNNTKTPTTILRATPPLSGSKKVKVATPEVYFKKSGLDNVFARYGANALGAPANAYIIDRCAGTPYPTDMEDTLDDILNMMSEEEEQLALFRNETNYGHIGPIYGTSDHVALVVDL